MRPQFFPWLFDDKNAWEKAFSDPRYNYELPIDCFMSLYQIDRKAENGAAQLVSPAISMPMMPLPTATTTFAPTTSPAQVFSNAVVAAANAASAPKEEAKREEGILSQDEIDALLSGL